MSLYKRGEASIQYESQTYDYASFMAGTRAGRKVKLKTYKRGYAAGYDAGYRRGYDKAKAPQQSKRRSSYEPQS